MARAAYFAIPAEAARGVSTLPQQCIRVLRAGMSGSLRGQVAQGLGPISSLIPLKSIFQGAPTGCAVSTRAREQQARRQQKPKQKRPSARGRDAFGSSLADVGCANGLQREHERSANSRSQERRNVLQGRQRPAQLSLELDAVQVLPRASIQRAANGGWKVSAGAEGGAI